MFRPIEPFNQMVELLNPVSNVVKGVTVKKYEHVDYINVSFKTYGGTEQTVNDIISVVDTANIETWYRPDIKSKSRIRLGSKEYEVIGEPEDINLRHQFLKFKVRRVGGGA